MKLKLFISVLILQTAWILGTTFVQERGLATGTVVLLETRPVDPRDFLRGDYIILNYKISDIPLNLFSPARTNGVPIATTVYVALEKQGEFYEAVTASTEPMVAGNGQVVLRGRSRVWWSETNVHVEYGLERYYVREGAGSPQGKITVQAAVPSSGRAQIKAVLVDGKPFEQALQAAGR